MFPNYETLHWYAAKYILDQLHGRFEWTSPEELCADLSSLADFNEEGKTAPEYLVTGAKALAVALESWTQKKDVSFTCSIFAECKVLLFPDLSG